jgi:hypothetical protein
MEKKNKKKYFFQKIFQIFIINYINMNYKKIIKLKESNTNISNASFKQHHIRF